MRILTYLLRQYPKLHFLHSKVSMIKWTKTGKNKKNANDRRRCGLNKISNMRLMMMIIPLKLKIMEINPLKNLKWN